MHFFLSKENILSIAFLYHSSSALLHFKIFFLERVFSPFSIQLNSRSDSLLEVSLLQSQAQEPPFKEILKAVAIKRKYTKR